VRPDCADAHCSYTGAAKVEPAPDTVADPPLEDAEPPALPDDPLDELELLPHAARPRASIAALASAPILFLVTTSPLAGLRDGSAATRVVRRYAVVLSAVS
jgi:hypothetical protein